MASNEQTEITKEKQTYREVANNFGVGLGVEGTSKKEKGLMDNSVVIFRGARGHKGDK